MSIFKEHNGNVLWLSTNGTLHFIENLLYSISEISSIHLGVN